MIHRTIYGYVLLVFGACTEATTNGSCDLKTRCLVCSWSQRSFRSPLSFDVESSFELMHIMLLQWQLCMTRNITRIWDFCNQFDIAISLLLVCKIIEANNVTEIFTKMTINFSSSFFFFSSGPNVSSRSQGNPEINCFLLRLYFY